MMNEKPRMTKECMLTLVVAKCPAPPIYPIRIVKHDRVNVVARINKNASNCASARLEENASRCFVD